MYEINVFMGSIDPEFNNYLGVVYSLAQPTVGMRLAISIPDKIRQTITIRDVLFMSCEEDSKTQTVLISF